MIRFCGMTELHLMIAFLLLAKAFRPLGWGHAE
jgi:hypothetical protein